MLLIRRRETLQSEVGRVRAGESAANDQQRSTANRCGSSAARSSTVASIAVGSIAGGSIAGGSSPSDLVPPVAGVGNSGPQTLADPGPKSAQPAAKLQGLLPQEDSEPLPVVPWQLPDLPDDQRRIKLDALEEQVKACRKCTELVCYRRQTVFGEGLIRPKVCFFGEAPGADEDAQGRPFVGAAGRLLNDIIRAMRLTREEVYILNSLKCRPPQNRTPLPEEIANCRPFALTQLEILQPQFIILLGAVAVRSVLQTDDSVGRLRGRFHQFHGARVVVTYHPAYLLRTPEAKKLVWSDVQMVMRELGLI